MQQAELHRRYERDFWLTNTTTTLLLSCHWLTPTDQQTVCRAHNFPGLLSLRFKPIFKIFFFLTTQVSWRCVRKRGQTEDMSEHEWEMCECVCFSCLSLPFLSLGFCVCVCFWDNMCGEVEFPEDSFNWEQRFSREGERTTGTAKEGNESWSALACGPGPLHVRRRTRRDVCVSPLMDAHPCVFFLNFINSDSQLLNNQSRK